MARLSGKNGSVLVASQLIDDCEDAWVTAGAGRVSSLDNTDYKVGSGSAKMVTTAIGATTLLHTEDFGAMDLTGYTHLMAWVKSSINQVAGDCQILLDDTAACASALETLAIPALVAGTWKYVTIALVTPAALGAVISVGLKQIVDLADMSMWLDDIRAAKAIAGIRAWTLEEAAEVVDVTGFDHAGISAFIPTVMKWSGSFEGFKDGAPLAIGSVVGLELRESQTATQQYRGSAIITGCSDKVDITGAVMYSYTFQGTHGLERATA